MEPALKQRLVGATVLIAVAVIFLPMLIKGPAPESGVSDVSLDLPEAPTDGFETRELPLLAPRAPAGAAVTGVGSEAADVLPTVDTREERAADAADAADPAEAGGGMMPAATAGGGYAVSFGSYATSADAARVVEALRASQLPGYQEPATAGGRAVHRVRIGPFDSRATAETARLRAAHVRDDVGSQVLVLDADASATAAATTATPPAAQPVPRAAQAPATPTPRPQPAAATPAPPPAPAAAAGVGFAVQLGAFASEAEAVRLRDRARGLGMSAFVEAVSTDKGRLHRVQLGPVADRAAAEQLKAQAAVRLGIGGFVRAHP